MARTKSAPLAIADIPNLPAVGATISRDQAVQIAKQVGATMLRAAKAEQRAKREELAQGVGGQITRVDETVLDQARRLMARLALISQSKKSSRGYGGSGASSALDPIVKQMGAIVGSLEAMMLTDRSVGLFEDVLEHEYAGYYNHDNQKDDPAASVGDKARDLAREILAQYIVVDDAASAKRGRGQKNVTPTEPIDDGEREEIAAEDVDEASFNRDGDA